MRTKLGLAVVVTLIASHAYGQPFAYVLQSGQFGCGFRTPERCVSTLWMIDIDSGDVVHREVRNSTSWLGPLALTGAGRLLAWSGGLVDRMQPKIAPFFDLRVYAGPATNRLFGLNPSQPLLRVVDVGAATIETFDVSLSAAGTSGVAVMPDGVTAFVGNDSGIAIVNVLTRSVTGTIPLPGTATPSLLLSPDGSWLYTVRAFGPTGTLHRINSSSGVLSTTRTVTADASLAFTPDGSRLWIHDTASSVARVRALDPTTLADVATVALPSVHGASGPLAVTADSARLIVSASAPAALYAIDILTTKITRAIELTTVNPLPLSGLVIVKPSDVCNYRATVSTTSVGADGGTVILGAPAPEGCSWPVQTDEPWIELGATGGTGTGNLTARIRPNRNSQSRSGNLTLALQTFAITQSALTTAAGAPLPPSSLVASTRAGRIVDLAWTPSTAGASPSHFVVEAGSVSGDYDRANVTVGLTTAVTGGPLPIGDYWVHVRGMNSSGIGDASREAFFSIPPLISLDDFAAFWEDALAVTLRWRGQSGSSTVLIEAGGGPGRTDVILRVPPGGSEWRIPMAEVPLGTYYVRARGENISGIGPPSNEVRFSRTCQSPPPALFDFFANVEAGQIVLGAYIHSTEVLDFIRVLVGRSSGNAEVGVFQTYTRFSRGALLSGRYYLRAQGVNACGAGPMSVERVIDVP